MVNLRRLAPAAVLFLFPLFVLGLVGAAIAAVVALTSQLHGHGGGVLVKLLVFPLAAALWYGIKDARSHRPTPAEGPELTQAEHPELWAQIHAAAAVAQTQPPARVVMVPEVNAAVGESNGQREMLIGLPLFAALTVSQLRSVLAHELGHYAGGDTAHSARIARRVHAIAAVHQRVGFFYRPLIGLYARLYALAAAPASREAETQADRFSIQVAGPGVAAEAMRALIRADLAWTQLGQQYLPMFEEAGARAPLAEGMRRLVEANGPAYDDVVSQVLRTERARADDTHPATRDRIAMFDAAQASGVAPHAQDDRRFASALITGGEQGLAQLEAHLLIRDAELVDWDTLVHRAGSEMVAQSSAQVRRFLSAHGQGSGTLADAITLVQAPDNGYVRLIAAADDVSPEAAGDDACGTLVTMVQSALLATGAARFVASFDGPMQLVDRSGTRVDLRPLVSETLRSGDGSALTQWLAGHGVDLQAVGLARSADRPSWLAVLTHVDLHGTKYDVHLWNHGLLGIPLTTEQLKQDRDSASHKVQQPRVRHQAALGLPAGQASPGAFWFPVDHMDAIEVSGRMSVKLTVHLRSGGIKELRSAGVDGTVFPDGESFGAGVFALQQRIAERADAPSSAVAPAAT